MDKDVKISCKIVQLISDILGDIDNPTDDIINLHIYLRGKVLQSNLGADYDKNDTDKISLYNKNKKLLEELKVKIIENKY